MTQQRTAAQAPRTERAHAFADGDAFAAFGRRAVYEGYDSRRAFALSWCARESAYHYLVVGARTERIVVRDKVRLRWTEVSSVPSVLHITHLAPYVAPTLNDAHRYVGAVAPSARAFALAYENARVRGTYRAPTHAWTAPQRDTRTLPLTIGAKRALHAVNAWSSDARRIERARDIAALDARIAERESALA